MFPVCVDCRRSILNAKSISRQRCDYCKKNREKQLERNYKMRNRKECVFCGCPVVFSDKYKGIIHCRICGVDGTGRIMGYKAKREFKL